MCGQQPFPALTQGVVDVRHFVRISSQCLLKGILSSRFLCGPGSSCGRSVFRSRSLDSHRPLQRFIVPLATILSDYVNRPPRTFRMRASNGLSERIPRHWRPSRIFYVPSPSPLSFTPIRRIRRRTSVSSPFYFEAGYVRSEFLCKPSQRPAHVGIASSKNWKSTSTSCPSPTAMWKDATGRCPTASFHSLGSINLTPTVNVAV